MSEDWKKEFFEKLCEQVDRANAVDNCEDCRNNPRWERRTQFAGNHLFCDEHAMKEPDFGDQNSSYFYWRKLD